MSEQKDLERAAFEDFIIPSWSLEKRTDSDGDTVYVEDWVQGAWIGWQKARSLPVGVPDGYALVPVEPTEAMLCAGYFTDHAANRAMWKQILAAAPAAPTVKAEQVDVCDTCHGQGEVYSGHDQHFHYLDFQPPEPIMEVCPECGGEEATSLSAAGSAELTASQCACGDEYPANSYGAGFMAANNGVCENCDAANSCASEPAADGPAEWIEHGPSKACPFSSPYTSKVDVRLRDGTERLGDLACNTMWFWYEHDPKPYDVVAYRIAALSAQQSAQPEFFCEHCWPDDFKEGGKWHGGFTEQQSAPERVSVPVELLERLADRASVFDDGDDGADSESARSVAAELRALLASHGRGEA